MRKLFITVSVLLISIQLITAQNKTEYSNLSREEIMKENSKDKENQIGLVLTIDKEDGSVSIDMKEGMAMYREEASMEEQIKAKYAIQSLDKIQSARSFLEVIQLTSGQVNIKSHEVILYKNLETHYFIFTF